MNTPATRLPAGTRAVGLVYVVLGLWFVGMSSYQYFRFRHDAEYRARTVSQAAQRAHDQYLAEHTELDPMSRAEVRIDTAKVEAALEQQTARGFATGMPFGFLLMAGALVVKSQVRWRRPILIAYGVVFCVLGLSLVLRSDMQGTLADWTAVAGFIALGVVTLAVARKPKLETGSTPRPIAPAGTTP